MRMKRAYSILVVVLLFIAGQSVMAQGAKKPAPKPGAKPTAKAKGKPLPPATGVVVSLKDVFLGASPTEFAANGKVLRGSLKVGEKLQIITIDDKIVDCTVKKMVMDNTHLESKQAGKDYEAFIVFDAGDPNLEYSFGSIFAPNSVKTYLEFQEIAQAYKPTPLKKGVKPGDTSHIFSLEVEKDPNAPAEPKAPVQVTPQEVKVIKAPVKEKEEGEEDPDDSGNE
jgi:hypothetical protein